MTQEEKLQQFIKDAQAKCREIENTKTIRKANALAALEDALKLAKQVFHYDLEPVYQAIEVGLDIEIPRVDEELSSAMAAYYQEQEDRMMERGL